MEDAPSTINQDHSGSGDNVNQKVVYQLDDLTPEKLTLVVENICYQIRVREFDRSSQQIKALTKLTNKNDKTDLLVEALVSYNELIQRNETCDTYQSFEIAYQANISPICNDLCLSAIMRLDVRNDQSAVALHRYEEPSNKKELCNEVFYELLAAGDELKLTFEKNNFTLTEPELCGLLRGALRLSLGELACQISNILLKKYSSHNSSVLDCFAKASMVEQLRGTAHYWSLPYKIKADIDNLTTELITLIEGSKGQDLRLFHIAAPTLVYTLGDSKKLSQVCYKYIDELEKLYPDVAEKIRGIEEGTGDFLYKKISAAKEDRFAEKKMVQEVLADGELNAEQVAVLGELTSKKPIKKWMESGGEVSGSDELEIDFLKLELQAIACDENPIEMEQLRKSLIEFNGKYSEGFVSINPPRLMNLSDIFYDLEMYHCCELILKPIAGQKGTWLSPLVRGYILALLEGHQHMALQSYLESFPEECMGSFYWQIITKVYANLGEYSQAVEAIEKAISYDQNSILKWYNYIFLLIKMNADESAISSVLNRIPIALFDRVSEYQYGIVCELANHKLWEKAENILLGWFLHDPDSCCIWITNFVLGACNGKNIPQSENELGVKGGVVYEVDGKLNHKLIVEDAPKTHSCIIDSDSQLGNILFDSPVGSEIQMGMQEIKVIEKLPPLISAFRLSLRIREDVNDGSDCFHSFTLPDDPKEMVTSLEKKLSSGASGKDKIASEVNLPLYFKGYRLNSLDPVEIALQLLTTSHATKQPLPSSGENYEEKVIIDAYSAIYLSLTGLYKSIEEQGVNIVLTDSTRNALESWIDKCNSEGYMTLGAHPEGGIWRTTAEEMNEQTKDIQQGIQYLLSVGKDEKLNLVDLPPILLKIQAMVDDSVFSSLKLSIANDISWLCIDAHFASILHGLITKPLSSSSLVMKLDENREIKDKILPFIYHINCGLPYHITYQDLLLLSQSDEEYAHWVLAEILLMYPSMFSKLDQAIPMLNQYLLHALRKACADGELLKGFRISNLRNNGDAERVFNASCRIVIQCEDKLEAEQKLAKFLSKLFLLYYESKSILKLISVMASHFANGHFLSIEALNNYIKIESVKLIEETEAK